MTATTPRQAPRGAGAPRLPARLPLLVLFAGTFAVGTDGFMIAGLVPQIAREFAAGTAAAAQLVTVFAVTYAVGAPVVAALLGRFSRRTVLAAALAGLAAMNALAALAPVLVLLFAARIAAALAACLYTPTAAVAAAELAGRERRGRALGVVTAGLTLSIVTGVPLGTLIGDKFGWRATFAGVALVSVITAAAVRATLPASLSSPAVASVRARIAALRAPGVPRVLATTFFGISAGYLGYTYVAPVSHAAGASGGGSLAVVLAGFGVGGACGAVLSGSAADRYGQPVVVRAGAIAQAVALAALAVTDSLATGLGTVPVAAAFTLLGAGSFTYNAPQQHRLMQIAPGSATTLVSLNSSAIYAGIGISGLIGGFILRAGPAVICLTAAVVAASVAMAARMRP